MSPHLYETTPPQPRAGELLVRVPASSINDQNDQDAVVIWSAL
jgi:NADPH:quinone reductase-like Zn-dependent oxidoreductase